MTKKSSLLTPEELYFPLSLYDDSTFDERMTTTTTTTTTTSSIISFPQEVIVLKSVNNSPEASLFQRGLGIFQLGEMLEDTPDGCCISTLNQDDNNNVDDNTILSREKIVLPRFYVCLSSDSLETYTQRILQALHRRSNAIALMKYHFLINSIPYDGCIITSLEEKQLDKIVSKARSQGKITEDYLFPTLESSLEEAKIEYEEVMKKIMFNITTLNAADCKLFFGLNLPISLLFSPRKLSIQAYPEKITYQYKQLSTKKAYESDGYFSSVEAIKAMQCVVEENLRIEKLKVLNLTYSKSMHLDKMEKYFQEMLLTAVRAIKVDWSLQTHLKIKKCFSSSLDNKYDLSQRNGHDYHTKPSNIKSLLERINFMMSHVLVGVVNQSLYSYTEFISQLCRYSVVIENIQNITVTLPYDSIYKVKVLQPLGKPFFVFLYFFFIFLNFYIHINTL